MSYGPKQTAKSNPEELRKILETQFAALLAGSRALGYARDDSDYDYFVQWQFGVEHRLTNIGFRPIDSSYLDPTIVGVLRNECQSVDVILVRNLKVQTRIMKLLAHSSAHLWVSKIPEGNMYDFWTVLVCLAMQEPDKK